jgi:hypothetical protein
VLTGTPAGVGLGHKPVPRFLQDGDVMRLGGQGLSEQRIHCRAWVRRTPKAAEAAVRKHVGASAQTGGALQEIRGRWPAAGPADGVPARHASACAAWGMASSS